MPTVPDKMYLRLGEVIACTGFSKDAVLKMKAAGTLKPVTIRGYAWECYPRQQVLDLLKTTTTTTNGHR